MNQALRVALAQLNFKVGDLEGNTDKIMAAMERARSDGANLVVFSEIALLGYPPRDLVHRPALLARQDQALKAIAAATDDELAAVVGYVERNEEGRGHGLINAAAFCANGEIVQSVTKQLLPTYDVFDEARYFSAAPSEGVVTWAGVKIGISICEDAWARVKTAEMPRYDVDPIAELAGAGAQVLLNLSASPFSLGKAEFRCDLLADHSRRHQTPLIFVNQVGGNDELIFDGRSLVLDAGGELKVRLAEFEEDYQVVHVDSQGQIEAKGPEPALRRAAENDAARARDALVLGIGDYVRKTGHAQVLLGLSGGIDSSLVAALVARALGPENVHAVAMPSRFSSSHSREDARQLSKNLGIEFDEIPIEAPYASALEVLQPHFGDTPFGVAEENIQARLRGLYLMALSNKFGKLVLACGNKSELAVGYCTLYGDMCGALAVIGDLPKMLVYDVARLINEEAGRDIVPQRVLEKPPSAELRPDQKDEDSLPPYEVLDQILERYLVEHQSAQTIVEAGFDGETVRRVITLVHRNEYKRWQAPPVLKVTTKAFGVGWRYPLAASPPE